MNSKAKGSRNERKSMAILEAAGYVCMKAGASLGVFDVIGVSATDMIGVQTKSNRWPSALEMEAIREFKAPSNFRKLVHCWRDYKRTPDVREV